MRAACRAVALLLVFAPLAHAAPPGPLTILRDAFGVPQLFTTGPQALQRGAYANGWAQAEDRLFELDGGGRIALLSDIAGPALGF